MTGIFNIRGATRFLIGPQRGINRRTDEFVNVRDIGKAKARSALVALERKGFDITQISSFDPHPYARIEITIPRRLNNKQNRAMEIIEKIFNRYGIKNIHMRGDSGAIGARGNVPEDQLNEGKVMVTLPDTYNNCFQLKPGNL